MSPVRSRYRMSDLDSLWSQLREAAETHGSAWLQSQIASTLQGVGQGPSSSRPASVRARRSRPPERLSPDNTRRPHRRLGSHGRTPSGPLAKQSARSARGGLRVGTVYSLVQAGRTVYQLPGRPPQEFPFIEPAGGHLRRGSGRSGCPAWEEGSIERRPFL